ncbi:MAG: hypothetical protein GQ564_21650 [Bacteroidales bacterium]|nr:hypothetical protein [Bacteroidales bacterium]
MSNYNWISCGYASSRLELFGSVDEESSVLKTIAGIRISNYEGDPDADLAVISQIDLDEIELDQPIILNDDYETVKSLSYDNLVIEGFEGPENRFLDLIFVSGWKLEFTQEDDVITFNWYLLSDWEIDAHPDYFPGSAVGEVSITGKFGENTEPSDISIEIPWPLAVEGTLSLGAPSRQEDRWSTPVDPLKILSIFDSTGPLLRNFPLGFIDLSFIKDRIEESLEDFLDDFGDFFSLVTGIDNYGRIFFEIRISPPPQIDIAEFGGLKLALMGEAAIVLAAVFEDDHIEFSFGLFVSNNVGLKLHGPFMKKAEGALSEAREIMAMLPIEDGVDIPDFPKLEIDFDLGDEPLDITFGSVNFPLRWDFIPEIGPAINFLQDIPLIIDPSQLVGFKFGSLDGNAPQVEMEIEEALFHNQAPVYGIKFLIALRIKLNDMGEPIVLKADWLFTFDTETMSFDPAASLTIKPESNEFKVGDLKVTGLNTLSVSFVAGNLQLTAQRLKAVYEGISEDDSGFELEVSNLLIDGGGIDLELFLTGGVTKISGIGESFKGVKGQIVINRSRFESGDITAEGPLPWMDNATGSITLLFKEGFRLDRVQANFQLGIHLKSDWWVQLELQSVNIDIHIVNNNPSLILMVTGKVSIVPPPNSGGNFILSYLKSVNLEFKDLVLTKSFDRLPPGIKLSIVLAQPVKVDLLGVFGFEMRSIGIGSGFEDGEAALNIGGQVFFSSKDLKNTNPEFHKFKIGKALPNELMPQINFENLGLEFSFKPTLAVSGSMEYIDTPEWKGFKGSGKLTINKTVKIGVLLEFATVLRESDNKKLRVWMIYAEWQDINIKFVDEFYLRDLGVGFGWRKTLDIMDNPNVIIDNPSKGTMAIGPHLPSSWVDDLEGDDARWTVVVSAWLTYGLPSEKSPPAKKIELPAPGVKKPVRKKTIREKPSPLVGDVIIGLRSDLTVLISMRGWIFGVLDELKNGSSSLRPSVIGLLYYSARNKHLLATYVVDPTGTPPKGVPPAIVQSLIQNPFSFVLETKPDLFRLELGWPRQLTFPLGIYKGKAGFLMRTTSNSLTVGVGFEIAIDNKYSFGFSFGIGSIAIDIKIYIGVYGMILARIGNDPALYGIVGVNALVSIKISLSINFKIFWVRIKFNITQSIIIIVNARVDFGITEQGFGLEGYASASIRIWKFSMSAQVSFAMNTPALYEAHRRVFEGVTVAGNEENYKEKLSYLPEPIFTLPAIKTQVPRWRTLSVRKDNSIYILLLPEEDSWFASPDRNTKKETDDDNIPNYISSSVADYEITFDLENVEIDDQYTYPLNSDNGQISVEIPWNNKVTLDGESFPVGNLFFEPKGVQEEHKLIDQITEDPALMPELIADWRVRSEEGAKDGMNDDLELRPDVRSPKFSADDSLYDMVLEEACNKQKDDALSWQALCLAQTRWTEEITSRDEVMSYMFGDNYTSDLPESYLESDTPNDKKNKIYARRKYLLKGMENMKGIRGGLISTLIHQFQQWTNTDSGINDLDILKNSGLALKFDIQEGYEDNFNIDLKSLKINLGNNRFQEVNKSQIVNGQITPDDSGIGFNRDGTKYRIKNLLEFQDQQGIYFSWEFECATDDGEVYDMSEGEASGLQEESKHFEFFNHYEVERTNLSNSTESNDFYTWKVKPGYLPAMVDIGSGNRNFYLAVPRFEFLDIYEASKTLESDAEGNLPPQAPEVGDQLIYSITAIDIFGNRSDKLEFLTTRKHLEPPPAPKKGIVHYEVDLSPNVVDNEQFSVTIEPSQEMSTWTGSTVRYEIWSQSLPLSTTGYYGLGDDLDDLGDGDDNPIVSPKGMQLIGIINDENKEYISIDLSVLSFGQVHAFYVRAISSEGNASRLIRCEHFTMVNATKKKPMAYLERIPTPTDEAIQWVAAAEIRAEVTPLMNPFANTSISKYNLKASGNPERRDVSFKMIHNNFVDDGFKFPTGGYEVYVKDRDLVSTDELKDYNQQVVMEILSPKAYGNSPYDTADFEKWSSNFLSEDSSIEGSLNWGEAMALEPTDGIADFSSGLFIHARLKELLNAIVADDNLRLQIHGGGISTAEEAQVSFNKILENYSDEKDPSGLGFLRRMGRTVDLAIYADKKLMNITEMEAWLNSYVNRTHKHIENKEDLLKENEFDLFYDLGLEVLLNSDKRTPMHYYRISLLPKRKLLSTAADKEERELNQKKAKKDSFESFANALVAMKALEGPVIGIDDEKAQIKYEAFADRFIKQFGVSTSESRTITTGVSFFNEVGDISRTVNEDDTISFQLTIEEPLARRFAYRIKRISRYFPLYEKLGLLNKVEEDFSDQAILIRLPRIDVPKVPTIEFVGNSVREEIECSEWLLREHEEEAMVQSNETMRNRLGYRGMAWSLYAEVNKKWREWSGWDTDENWLNKKHNDNDKQFALTNAEKEMLEAEPSWLTENELDPKAGLGGHPFTELLLPKGTLIRIPKLPFYYAFRLAAFTRTDDVDSKVKMTDQVQSLPIEIPTISNNNMGWNLNGDEIKIWWKVPSVWESLDEHQKRMWKNEAPFAKRLWDFDLKYVLQISRGGTVIPLAYLQIIPPGDDNTNSNVASFNLTTAASHLFMETTKQGKIEKQPEVDLNDGSEITPPIFLEAWYNPELLLKFKVSKELKLWLNEEKEDFYFQLKCLRGYGYERVSMNHITQKDREE